MYKLREERLKALYAPSDAPITPSSPYIMEQHNTSSAKFGLSKTSVTGSHGDSLADQSFESFKTKEIRDSESPTRFGTVIPSDNSGWHVTTAEERSADGKTHTIRSSAATEGTKDIQGGRTAFTGKNEEVSSNRFEGDDKNFVHSTGDQSSTFLAENSVVEGQDGSTISKKSTSVSSSSSKVIRSQQTYGDSTESDKIELPPANTNVPEFMCGLTTNTRQQTTKSTIQTQETDGNMTSKPLSSDPDRVSEAFRLAELPGKVIEQDIRMINPSTRMITITKKLEDGTTVTTRNYEKIGVEPEKPFDQEAHAATQKRLNAAVEALSKGRDETEHRSTKKDITEKVTNLQFIAEERMETERIEQIKKQQYLQQQQQQQQQQETLTQQKVSVDVNAAHDSFARSLRCASPTESVRSVRSNSATGRSSVSPDKSVRGRRSPSRESDTSRLSTHTTTRSSRTDVSSKDYMKPTITSERKQSTFKDTVIQESSTVEDAYDTVDKTKLKDRSTSPKKVPQNSPDMTPRGPSPDKLSRHVAPKDSTPFCLVDTPRGISPTKRDSSPAKMTSAKLVRENSSETFNVDTTITVSTKEKKQQQMREDVEVFDTAKLVTENDDITINVKLENVTDDIEVTTTVEEVDLNDKKPETEDQDAPKSEKTPKKKPPLLRSETFEERCRKILGMPGKVDSVEETTETNTSSVFSTYDNTVTRSSEIREKRKKMEQEIKSIETETMRAARKTNEFLTGERRPSAPATSPDRKGSAASPTMKATSPVRKQSQPSPERRPQQQQQQPLKDSSTARKYSQPSPERRPKDETPSKKPSEPKQSTPVRKHSKPSPDRRPKDEQSPQRKPVEPKESSPIRKHSQPSPDRRPKDEQLPQRKPVEPKEASPDRKHSQPSPVRQPSELVKEPSPHRCSRSHDRSPSPKPSVPQEKSPVRKALATSPTRKASRDITQTDSTVVTKTVTSKADILVNQKQEGKNISVTEITIQPANDTKKSDKVLTKQTSDTKFDRRSTSSRVVTNKSSSDFDVKRKAYIADKTESDRTTRTVTKPRTPATSPEKRRPQDTSPTKSDRTKHHITIAKIKIEPVRKPVLAKVVVEDRSTRLGKTTRTTKKVVDEYTEPESDKDTGISDNEIDDELMTTVETTTTTVTTTKRSDRKDSAPVNRTTGKVEKSYTRSSSDNVLKSNNASTTKKTTASKTTAATSSTTTSSSAKKIERPVKCVTTKTINLSAKPTIDSDILDNVVIDIQHAKSSREPTPNKLIPIPVSPDEDTGKPRYPDAVQEPDDDPKHVPKVSNVPIFEEATNEYIGCEITEVEDHEVRAARACRITNLDRVTEDDESLMSVTQKVSKFVEEANKLKDAQSKAPNRFVRCEYDEMNEHLKSDECLLSVSDKVTKFISTAEEVKKIKTSGLFVPECKVTVDVTESDEHLQSVNEKASKYAHVDNQKTSETKTSTVKTTLDEMDRSFVDRDDESLQSVSEKKKKFISGTSAPQKSPELVKNIMKQTTRQERNLDEEEGNLDSEHKTTITERYTTATLTKPKDKVPQSVGLRSTEAVKKAKQIFENGNKPAASELARQKDILSRPSIWEDRRKKEQTATENSQTDVKLTDIGVYKKTQPKVEPEPKKEEPIEPKQEAPKSRRDSVPKTPAYIKDTVSTKKDLFEKRISSSKLETSELIKSTTSQEDRTEYTSTIKRPSITEKYERSISRETPTPGNKPSYMSHTVCSLEHVNAGRRESVDMTQRSVKVEDHDYQQDITSSTKSTGKFGVELKRGDSAKNVIPASIKRKPSIDSSGIEDIFELEVLEKMLEVVTGYEQRRRIRAQIRLVKKSGEKSISGVTTTTTTTTSTMRTNSRVRDPSPKRKDSSPTRSMTTRKSLQDTAEAKVIKTVEVEKKSEQVQRSASPTKTKPLTNGKATATTTVTTTMKTSKFGERVAPTKGDAKEDKPIWATSNILKKASDGTRSFKTTSSTTSSTAKKATTIMRDVPKETKPTDCITSSYGVGPTDENGLPLFGIRALKKKSAPVPAEAETTTSKVSGSIFTETFYSENGSAPVGERKTTVYSSDAKDLENLNLSSSKRSLAEVREKLLERENSRKGLISVTKTEKIGNGSSHVTTEIGALDDLPQRGAKIVRKGSVKELTERFVHKESSSSLMSEKTYPKAGLILRSTQSHSSRSSTPCENISVRSGSVDFDENDIELRSGAAKSVVRESALSFQQEESGDDGGVVFRKSHSSSSSSRQQARSFLNDGSRVSGVQDVLERMRNADNVEESGDSAEDREARALLNKFLGASVLMSGMESMMASSAKEEMSTAEGSAAPGTKKVSKVTTTRTVKSTASSSSNNAPKPSIENLEQIWDEAVLKQLLDSTTNYEERRKIRARLRQIMAEKEACADIVASVTADLQRERQLQQQQSTDSSASGIHGESLLLPLLQGILLHNKSGAGGQVGTASAGGGGGGRTSAAVSLPIPPVEDSGTESGEDLRLLAAGLHDNIEMYRGIGVGNVALNGGVIGDGSSVSNVRLPVDSGDSILHEVTAALQRLQLSLRDGKDINLATNKRNALLTLVCRLQTGLMQPDELPEQVSPVNELTNDNIEDDKVDYNQARRGSARFAKRRNRNNRHTVGVSREELADARRFIEEIGRMSSHSHSATPEKPQLPYSLQKQQSLGTVLPSEVPVPSVSTFAMKRPSQFMPKELNHKPELIVNGRDRKVKQKLFRQSQSFDQSSINGYEPSATQLKPIDVKSLPVDKNEAFKKPVQTAAQRALVKKYSFNDGSTSEDDEPRKTAEQVVLQKNTAKGSAVINTVHKIVNREVKQDPPAKSVHPSVARKAAINRSRTPESHDAPVSGGEGNNKPINKYTSKKLRMKRANTIDIPKKLLSNAADSDDDSEDDQQPKPRERSREVKAKTSVASVGKPVAADVPDFKPKTENDIKFMAFLQKQNQTPKQMWTNPVKEHVGSNNWTSKFDHLKNNFESAGRQGNQPPPMRSAPKSSAMNFWKKAESTSFDESHLRHPKPPKPVQNHHAAPKPPTQPKLPPRSMQQQQQPPALPAKPKMTPQPLPKPVVVSKPEPKHPPTTSNQFTHAASSAFKPIPKKLPAANLGFKSMQAQEPEIIKPIPAHISCGIVKQIVASGFKETPEEKPEPKQVQLGLVKSLAAAGYHETPYVPLPKLERTPTHHVLNYQAHKPERAESPTTPPAPWVGKNTTEGNNRVASIASTKFTANQFGMNKGNLPAQTPLTYQGSLKYNEKPLSLQMPERLLEKRPSLPDVNKALPKPADNFLYTFTDYTQPESVSTFTLNRSDSLTNPENEPLVLTSTNSIYSPAGQQMNYLGTGDRRNSSSLSPNIVDDEADDLDSLDSQEMRAVSKVMRAPVSQQASFSSNKPSHLNSGSGDDRSSMIAQSLQSSLKKIQHKSPTPPNKLAIAAAAAAQKRFSHDFSGSLDRLSSYAQRSAPQFSVPKVEVTPQTPAAAPQQQASPYGLPSHVIYNNVQGFAQSRPAYQAAPLSRTDSWVRLNQQPAPSALSRTKSSHTLAVPQSFDGGHGQPNRTVTDKQRTMEAYFAGQKPTLNALSKTSSTHNILRDKSGMTQNSVRPVSYALGHSYNPAQYNIMTPQQYGSSYQPQSSMYAQRTQPMMTQQPQTQYYQPPLGGGLSRSRTMPHIPMNNVSLLDEENVEDAFEELMSQSFAV
ncbi:mucin-2-like isoform X2 [Ochlerotatus camptorhynchus]